MDPVGKLSTKALAPPAFSPCHSPERNGDYDRPKRVLPQGLKTEIAVIAINTPSPPAA